MRAYLTLNRLANPPLLVFSCPESGIPDETRPFPADQETLLRQFCQNYQTIAQKTPPHQQHSRLLELGQEIFRWLCGSQQWLPRLISKITHPPLILEFITAPIENTEPGTIFLSVPWELAASENNFLAAEPYLQFCPVRRIGPASPPPDPSPWELHMVFMAAAPEKGDAPLNYEAEETAILQAAGEAGLRLTVEESGHPAQLALRLTQLTENNAPPPEILHISCHGACHPIPVLLLESETGTPLKVTASALAQELTPAMLPRLLMLSACETAQPGAFAQVFAHDMVRAGVSAVMGWDGPVGDQEASWFAARFYRDVARRGSVEEALARTRCEMLNNGAALFSQKVSLFWHKARLCLGAGGGGVLSSGNQKRPFAGPCFGHKEMPDKKRGRSPVADRHEFVGRRRELQRVLREMKAPQGAGVLLHGFGRQGKSSLAAQVIHRLEPGWRAAILFNDYRPEAFLEALNHVVGSEPLRLLTASRWQSACQDRGGMATLLREILENREQQYLGDQGLLVVVDDFEQVLEAPEGEELYRVKENVRPFFLELLEVFEGLASKVPARLLFTSRYRFSLPGKDNRDMADTLIPVHVPPMKKYESVKQAKAKGIKEISDLVMDSITETAGGNPGLQDLLLRMALLEPEACEKALAEAAEFRISGRWPQQEQLAEFMENLAMERLMDLLQKGEKELLRVSTIFQHPVPLGTLAVLAQGLGLREGKKAVERLLAFGVWDEVADAVVPGQWAGLVNPLMKGRAGRVAEDEIPRLAGVAVEDLWRRWGGENKHLRPLEVNRELGRLALAAQQGEVLRSVAAYAVLGFMARFDYRGGAEYGKKALAILASSNQEAPILLLSNTAQMCQLLGEIPEALTLAQRAAERCSADSRLSEKVEVEEYSHVLLVYGDLLENNGRPDEALEIYQQLQAELGKDQYPRQYAFATGSVARNLSNKGRVDEALRLHEEVLIIYESLGDVRSRAGTLGDIANLLSNKGRVDEALRLHEEALSIYESRGDRRSRAVTLGEIAYLLSAKGRKDEAFRLFEEKLAIVESLGDVRSRAVTLGEIANLLSDKGQGDEALHLFEESLSIYESLGDVRSRAVTLGKIAKLLSAKGRDDEALRLHEEALSIFESLGDVRPRGMTLVEKARLLSAKGQVDEALRMHDEALSIFESLGDVRSRAVTLGDIAYLLSAKGRVDEALSLHEKRLAIFESQKDVRSRAETLGYKAQLLLDKGQEDDALRLHEEALNIYESLGDVRSRAETLRNIANIWMQKNQLQKAMELQEECLEIARQMQDMNKVASTLFDMAQIEMSEDNPEAALFLLQESYDIAKKMGILEGMCFSGSLLGHLLFMSGDEEEGIEILKLSYQGFKSMGMESDAKMVLEILKMHAPDDTEA